MEIKVEFSTGKQLPNHWSGVFGYRPDKKPILDSLGEIFAVIKLKSDADNVDLESIAGLLLDHLQESYYELESVEEDFLIRLEDAMWGMRTRLEEILSRETAITEKGLDLEMAVAVVSQNFMYCGVVGESKIFVKRNEKFIDISKVLIDANMMGFLKSGSLELQSDDRVILATSVASEKGKDLMELAVDSLDISKVEGIKNELGVGVLLLADKNQTWGPIEVKVEETAEVENKPKLNEEIQPFEDKTTQKLNEEIGEDLEEKEEKSVVPIDENTEEKSTEVPNLTELQPKSGRLALLQKSKGALKSLQRKGKVGYQGLKTRVSRPQSKEEDIESEQIKQDTESVGDFDFIGEPENKLPLSKLRGIPSKKPVIDKESQQAARYLPSDNKIDKKESADEKVEDLGRGASAPTTLIKNVVSAVKKFGKKLTTGNKTYSKILRDVGNKIKQVLQSIYQVFRREVIGSGDRRDMYTRAKRLKRNRRILVIAVVVLAVVLFIVVRNAQNQREFNNTVAEKRQAINEIRTKVDSLAPQIQEAKTQSEDKKDLLISQLDTIAINIEKLKKDAFINENSETFTNDVNDLNNLSNRVQSSKDTLQLIVPFAQPQVITDVGKVYPDATLSDIEYSNGYVYISDSARGVVYRVDASQLDVKPDAYVSGLVNPKLLVRNVGGEIIFYDSDTTSAIGRIDINTASTFTRYPSLPETNIGTVKEVTIFGGNDGLYEIHQNHQEIFKRIKIGNDYAGGGAIFEPDSENNWKNDPELGSAIDIDAPYELYVLIQGKGIKRYLGGGENDLDFSKYVNLSQKDFTALSKATAIGISGNYLAVAMDPSEKRILLFEISQDDAKLLKFVKQYVYRGSEKVFDQLDEVVVDDINKKIYVLDGTRVIRLDI